jgi:D-serine deaminase-like pyridoxal phosphate-dependent protein
MERPETIRDLSTPFLTIDLDAVERNIARMQSYSDAHGLALRPHVKTHKMPLIASSSFRPAHEGSRVRSSGRRS